jgi:hypothetical protein
MTMGRSTIPVAYSNLKIGGYKKKSMKAEDDMAKSKNFIKKAIGNNKGVFKAKAQAAGKSTKEYAEEKKSAPGKLGKEARLAITLMKMNKKK